MTSALMLAMLISGVSSAQESNEKWRVSKTEHFRVIYPASAEAWGLEAAGQLEAIREQVNEEVGWEPPMVIDVVIKDPYGQANGSAWPFYGAPRMELWATPPGSESVLGHYRSWGELLLTHEYAHLVHLLRDSRNPLGKTIQGVTGIGPVTTKSPRWVSEGYATVVEGRLSGFGRPNADLRALLLRRLAQQGSLPAYGELNASSRYYGGSFAYLVGSAYLEWLEARAGEGALVDLWARMSARKNRSFDDAFAGVFGDSPAVLYDLFRAEVIHDAMNVAEQRPVDADTLWKETSWYTGGPAASADGEKLAAVLTSPDGPSSLVVWSLGEEDEEQVKEREEARAEQLELDPEDVLAVAPKAPPREELHRRTFATRNASDPRWMPDNTSLLFTSWQRRSNGRAGPDLFLWDTETGLERRITKGANIRSASPYPDASRALAVRQDWGLNQLVIVDLESGALETLTEPSVDVLYDSPSVAPKGERIAWLEHNGDGWAAVIHDPQGGGTWRVGGTVGGPIYSALTWSPDGESLYASVGADGFIEIHEIWGVGGARGQLTRTRGGALQPTANADTVFFLSMDTAGNEIHHLALDQVESDVEVSASAPVVRPDPQPAPEAPEVADVGNHHYGLGRTEMRPLVGGSWSRAQAALEVGVRIGDIIGRRDTLLAVSWGGETGITGGLGAFNYRGFPVEMSVQVFAVTEEPELMRRYGGLVRLSDSVGGQASSASWRVGGWMDRPMNARVTSDSDAQFETETGLASPSDGTVVTVVPDRVAGYGELILAAAEPRGAWLGSSLRLRAQAGATGDAAWTRGEGKVVAWLGKGGVLKGAYTLGASDTQTGLDRYRLGGVPSSVVPEDWQWSRAHGPAYDFAQARGSHRDEVSVDINAGGLSLFGERHRMVDGIDQLYPGGHGASAAGVRANVDFDALPFQRAPAGTLLAGLACRVEDATDGWAEKPCQTADDYSFWGVVNWKL